LHVLNKPTSIATRATEGWFKQALRRLLGLPAIQVVRCNAAGSVAQDVLHHPEMDHPNALMSVAPMSFVCSPESAAVIVRTPDGPRIGTCSARHFVHHACRIIVAHPELRAHALEALGYALDGIRSDIPAA